MLLLAAVLGLVLSLPALAIPGVIDDPDGFTHLRAAASRESAIVATVKRGEIFDFKGAGRDEPWWPVTLASGKKGYMHRSRIRFHVTAAQLADTTPGDEVNEWSRTHHLPPYYPTARAAAKGDPAAMRRFFKYFGDGAAAETHQEVLGVVIHLLGDTKLAKAISGQSDADRAAMRSLLVEWNAFEPFEGAAYMKLHFPKTSAALQLDSDP